MSETIEVDASAVEALYHEVVAQTENIAEEYRDPEIDSALDEVHDALFE